VAGLNLDGAILIRPLETKAGENCVGAGQSTQSARAHVLSLPASAEVEAAARLLVSARRLMIVAGKGAEHAAEAVRLLSEAVGAPVVAPREDKGKGHLLDVSSYAAFRHWYESDVLLGIGTRLDKPYLRWADALQHPDRHCPYLIRIDVDPAEMKRLVPHIGIVADAEAGTFAVLAAVQRLLDHTCSASKSKPTSP
jgi:acetolactate synthase I/II/III large subunit